MSNDYFTNSNPVAKQTLARASQINANLASLESAFDKLPEKPVLDTGRVTYALDTGAADVYAVALHIAATAYVAGMHITMKVATTNTGASTLNVDGIGAKAVKLVNGTDPQAGDLTAGDIVDLVYDGTNFVIISVVRSIINGQAAMSPAEIKAFYESNADTNEFTDAEKAKVGHLTVTGPVDLDATKSKLAGIEAGATADQTGAEIKTAYEAQSNTNAFTNSHKSKVDFLTVTGSVNLDAIGSHPFTSDGAISDGDPVALNADGTVSTVAADTSDTISNTAISSLSQNLVGQGVTVIPLERGHGNRALIVQIELFSGSQGSDTYYTGSVISWDADHTITVHSNQVELLWCGETFALTNHRNACQMGGDRIVVGGHSRQVSTDEVRVVAIQVGDDNTITVGSEVVVAAAESASASIAKIEENKAIIAYTAATDTGHIYPLTLDGLEITAGSSVTFSVDYDDVGGPIPYHMDVCYGGEGRAFCIFKKASDSDYPHVATVDIEGNTLTMNTSARVQDLLGSNSSYNELAHIGDNRAIASYGLGPGFLGLKVLSASQDGSWTGGTETDGNLSGRFRLAARSEDEGQNGVGVTISHNGSSPDDIQIDTFSWSGDTITMENFTETGFIRNDNDPKGMSSAAAAIGEREFLTLDVRIVTAGEKAQFVEVTPSNAARFMGFASAGVGDAESVSVFLPGSVADGQSGLTAGRDYYLGLDGALVDDDGNLSFPEKQHYAGRAISATEIIVGGGPKA